MFDHLHRVVVATRARARNDDQQVAHGGGLQGRVPDAVGVVRLDREHGRLASDLLCQHAASMSEFVS